MFSNSNPPVAAETVLPVRFSAEPVILDGGENFLAPFPFVAFPRMYSHMTMFPTSNCLPRTPSPKTTW